MNVENTKVVKPDENQDTAQTVDKSRRSFAKVGAIAPVIVSLASKPVFGAQCLSDILSVDQSHQRTDNCWGGWSPGAWKGPTGAGTPGQWNQAGFSYGTLISGQNPQVWDSYSGGSLVGDFIFPAGHTFPNGITASTIARVALNTPNNSDAHLHYIAVLLNIRYAAAIGSHYIFTEAQFLQILSGAIPIPPPYNTAGNFDAQFAAFVKAYYDQ